MVKKMTESEIIIKLLELVGAKKDEKGAISYRRGKRFKLTEFENSELGYYVKNNIDYINTLNLGGKVQDCLSSKIASLWLRKQGIILKKITVRKKSNNKYDRKYMIKSR